jgi:hypothetical protein
MNRCQKCGGFEFSHGDEFCDYCNKQLIKVVKIAVSALVLTSPLWVFLIAKVAG